MKIMLQKKSLFILKNNDFSIFTVIIFIICKIFPFVKDHLMFLNFVSWFFVGEGELELLNNQNHVN
jgi:hypothetical protein